MFIESTITQITTCVEAVAKMATQLFQLNQQQIEDLRLTLRHHIDQLAETLSVYVEAPYADKVYRDSYYHYFATKFGTYPKHCIRLSFFDVSLDKSSFREGVDKSFLQQHFLGFMVIRPTVPQAIGRSVISPKALKKSDFRICLADVPVTVDGIKLTATGFPHSSQDTETITCAETTVWALMEYFGHRYVNYRPVLPSEIIAILRSQSYERQWPSRGLVVEQISFALRELGFATRIYARQAHGADFFELLSCYVESGIPVAVTVYNQDTIAHALLCIGREPISPDDVVKTASRQVTRMNRTIHVVDNDRMTKNFVFVDDNLPVYAKADLNHPTVNYSGQDWQRCEIDSFIVPLYGKVYLEAYEAKQLIESFLLLGPYPLPDQYQLFLRFYLTSSRSYKEYVALSNTIQPELKTLVLGLALPKFIWVAELSTNELIKHSLADGVILLDATEANVLYNKPLVFAAYQNRILTFADEAQNNAAIGAINLSITPFSIYENNLTPFSTSSLSPHDYDADTQRHSDPDGPLSAGGPDSAARPGSGPADHAPDERADGRSTP